MNQSTQETAREIFANNSLVKAQENRLDAISQKYASKIIGEEKNIRLGVCALASRNLPKKFRFSLIVVNQTATGKSHFLNSLLEPLRTSDDVIDFTDFTEAYFKRRFGDLNGKILKVEQLEKRDDNSQLSFARIKHLMTEGKLVFGNVDEDKGKRSPVEYVVTGYPIILTTATDTNIDPETENRFLVVELDESEDQTRRINKLQLEEYSKTNISAWNKKDLEKDFEDLKLVSVLIKDIKIPFADKLETILPTSLNMRRDLPKILALTSVIAFLNHKNRDKFQSKTPENFLISTLGNTEEIHKAVIIAKTEDFDKALEIAGNSLKKALDRVTKRTWTVYEKAKDLFNSKTLDNPGGITSKELQKVTGMPESTLRNHLNILKENGFISKDESEREFKFYPLDKPRSDLSSIKIDYSEVEYQEWIKDWLENNQDYRFVATSRNESLLVDSCLNESQSCATNIVAKNCEK